MNQYTLIDTQNVAKLVSLYYTREHLELSIRPNYT